MSNPDIASGYAMAYPLGVVGILFSMLVIRWVFRIKMEKEEEQVKAEKGEVQQVEHYDMKLTNPQIDGLHVRDLGLLTHVTIVVSRVLDKDGNEFMPDAETLLHVGDQVRLVTDKKNERTVLLLGEKAEIKWEEKENNIHLVSQHHYYARAPRRNRAAGDAGSAAAIRRPTDRSGRERGGGQDRKGVW